MAGARPEGEDRQHCFPDDPAAVEFIPQVFHTATLPLLWPWPGVRSTRTGPPCQHFLSPCSGPVQGDLKPGHGGCTDQHFFLQTLLGFNEPNHADQADIEPAIAAAAWIELQVRGVAVSGPYCCVFRSATPTRPWWPRPLAMPTPSGSTSSGRSVKCLAAGHKAQFSTRGYLVPRFDYLATHHYTSSPDKTMQILKDYSDRYGGLKIWFTEFAVAREHDETAVG